MIRAVSMHGLHVVASLHITSNIQTTQCLLHRKLKELNPSLGIVDSD
jgi:hypothetical protein